MASYSATVGTTRITMVASQVDTITFDSDLDSVTVVNPGTNTADVWWTCDGSTPAVDGASSYYCPPGMADVEPVPTSGKTVVKVISSGTPVIRVQKG